jgi:hypothetical protein
MNNIAYLRFDAKIVLTDCVKYKQYFDINLILIVSIFAIFAYIHIHDKILS